MFRTAITTMGARKIPPTRFHAQNLQPKQIPAVLAGLVSFIAQAQFDSIILEVITLASAVVLATRVVLGYKRMYDRWASGSGEQ